MSKRWYWAFQNRLAKLRFLIEAGVYKQKVGFEEAAKNSGTLFSIITIGGKSLLWLTFFLFVTLYSEYLLRDKLGFMNKLTPVQSNQYTDQIRLYAEILTAIFSIYFATIGIILSAGYTKLRRDIIGLLTSEHVGSTYSRLLVFSASFCLAATSLPLFDITPGYFTYLIATLLTLLTSLTLFPLGKRLFYFFDLTPLVSGELMPKIAKHIEGAASERHSKSLANHHSKEAKRLFENMVYIDDLIKADVSNLETSLPSLSRDYTTLLTYYLHRKHEIDQDSYWFPRSRKHLQWFLAGDIVTDMALRTGMQLSPEDNPDLDWLESAIIQRLRGHIELAFKEEKYDLVLVLLGHLSSRISAYARGFHFDVGISEIRELKTLLENSLENNEATASLEHRATIVAISDAWSAIGSNLCLETLRRIFTFDAELAAFFEKDVWTKDAMRSLPSFLQQEIRFIADRVEFEMEVEGKILSKPKYLRQLTVQKLLTQYQKFLPDISLFYQKDVSDFSKSLIEAKLYSAAAQVVLASLHSFWKLPGWFENLSSLFEKYRAFQIYPEVQYALPVIDTDRMSEGFEKSRDNSIEMLVDGPLAAYIFYYKHDDNIPDHFGQIYYTLAEECVEAMDENNAEKLNKIVKTFIALAFFAADTKFSSPDLEVGDEFRLHLASSAFQDIASLAGLAILYAEYFSNPELLDNTLNSVFLITALSEDEDKYLERFMRVADSHSFSWSASPRNMDRINWKMKFENRAREDGFGDQMDFDGNRTHHSNIVNEFLNSHADAAHLFFALRVLPRIEPVDFNVDHHITSLKRRLDQNDGEAQE